MYVISKSDLLSNNMNMFRSVYFFKHQIFGKNLYFENFSVKSCTDMYYLAAFLKINQKPVKTMTFCDKMT